MKEKLWEKVVEVQRKSDIVMAMVPVFEEEVIKGIGAYASQVGTFDCEVQFYNEMASEWDLQNPVEMIFGLGDFNGHIGRRINGFESVHGGYGIGERNVEGRRLLEF